jgi:hypothetical protein
MMAGYKAFLNLCTIVVFAGLLFSTQLALSQSDSSQVAQARTACAADVQRLCPNVPSGGGQVLACLKQHKDQVSDACKRAVLNAMGQPGSAAGSTSSPAPAAEKPPAPTPKTRTPSTSQTPAAQPTSHTPSKSISGDRYVLMKQVKLIDQGLGNGRTAYDLLIPTTWDFKGWVNVNVAVGGCFGDFFSAVGDATSPDKTIEFQMLPKFTFQYADDPAIRQQMQTQNQKDLQVKLKACPIRAPINAEEFLRKDFVTLCTKICHNTTIVSAEPYPELEETVRHQLGMPPASPQGNAGNARIEAARVRIAFDDEKGQPNEGWMAAAIVVNVIPGVGRGSGYDWHAVNLLFFYAPKGQLDSNDRLFKLMMSSIRPDPDWQKFSNGVIANLYSEKQRQLQIQSQIIAAFRAHVADVINGVTMNAQAGANQAAFGADQLIRQVQTFRDPSTGSTYELSNQYDHAWLNGQNQYVMSDDPNFNPNGNLNGSWSQMQLVRPQP